MRHSTNNWRSRRTENRSLLKYVYTNTATEISSAVNVFANYGHFLLFFYIIMLMFLKHFLGTYYLLIFVIDQSDCVNILYTILFALNDLAVAP